MKWGGGMTTASACTRTHKYTYAPSTVRKAESALLKRVCELDTGWILHPYHIPLPLLHPLLLSPLSCVSHFMLLVHICVGGISTQYWQDLMLSTGKFSIKCFLSLFFLFHSSVIQCVFCCYCIPLSLFVE